MYCWLLLHIYPSDCLCAPGSHDSDCPVMMLYVFVWRMFVMQCKRTVVICACVCVFGADV